MADEVIIGNVGGDGVASEATLQALVRAIEKMGNQRGRKGDGDRAQTLANKAIAAGTVATDKQTAATQDQTGATKRTIVAAEGLTKGFGVLAARGVGQVLASLGNMAQEFANGSSNFADFARHVPIVGGVLARFAAVLDESMQSFQKLATSGANFNNDLLELRRTSSSLGLTLDEFTSVVGRNTERFAAIGGTATTGVQQIARLNKALGSQREELMAMGLSAEQVVETLTDYAYMTRAGARTQQMTIQQEQAQAAAAADYAKNLLTLSKLTGQDVKAQQEKLAVAQADIAFQMRLSRLAPEERAKVIAAMAEAQAMAGQTGVDYFKQQFLGMPPLTESTRMFQATMGESARVIQGMNRSAQDTSVTLNQFRGGQVDRMVEFVRGAANAGRNLEQVLAAAASGADGPGKELAEIFKNMNLDMSKYLDQNGRFNERALREDIAAAQRQTAARSASTDNMAKFNDALRRLREAFIKGFIDTGVFDLVIKGLELFGKFLSVAVVEVTKFFTKIKEGDIIGAIGSLFTGSSAILAIVGGITALFLGKAALGAMTAAIGGLGTRMAARLFGGGAATAAGTGAAGAASTVGRAAAGAGAATAAAGAGTAASAGGAAASAAAGGTGKTASAGKAIGDFGKGLGRGIGGVLKGLASGLAAFANPAILVGAGILSGAIVAIGAGIAGATWIMGKALPTFAEGLRGFADIDGSNLIKVGAGIGAIGVALAGMAVGSVMGAIGGVLTNLIEALPGRSLLDRLKEFSSMDLNAEKSKANADAIVAYSNAMSALGNTGALGRLVTNAVDGLIGFFGGEVRIPWDKIQAFQSITLDANKIKANAEAVTAFGRAMSSLPAIKGERSGGLIGTVADFFLGAEREQVPWAQMVAFGQLQLPTASIKANAEAMAAFGEALSKLPTVSRERTGGLIGAVTSFFMGDQRAVVPWEQMVAFGQLQLPTASIKANAEAMAAFGEALSKVPVVDRARTGGIMEGITSFFAGSRSGPLPWENLAAFGQLRIDATGVKNNAEAMTAFGNALSAFRGNASGNATPPVISQELIASLGRLAAIGTTGGLAQTASGLQAIANVQNLQTTISSLSALDASKLNTYNTALRDLTRALADLNKELSNENRGGLFGLGESRANAGDILRNISVNTSAGAGNTGQLNETMMRVIEVLQQTKDISEKIEKNTKRGSGADVANRDVSSF